jgi:hypothetical protein
MNVQIYGFTHAGKLIVLPSQDLAKVRPRAEENVREGQWRTWDAFETPSDDGAPRRLVASHQPDAPRDRI